MTADINRADEQDRFAKEDTVLPGPVKVSG